MKIVTKACLASLLMLSLSACNQAPAPNPNIDLAKAWVTAASTSRTAAMDMISDNMAEDGLVFRDRYVGFGIMLDTELSADEGRMVVSEVIAESPVADICSRVMSLCQWVMSR